MRALALLFLAACGEPVAGPQAPLPPNTEQVCTKVVECGAVIDTSWPQCIACLEQVADQWNEYAHAVFGEKLPEICSLSCDFVNAVADGTNLAKCAAGGWYGP